MANAGETDTRPSSSELDDRGGSGKNRHDFVDTDSSSSELPDEHIQQDLERLGRERPAIFPALYEEVFFVFVIVLSLTMSEYFTSGFNVLLPDLSSAFHIPNTLRTWPTAAPNLATGALLLPFARLCDQLGSRFIFISGHVWLMLWSIIGGFCRDTIIMIVARAMQGVGTAALLPAGLALLGNIYRPGPRKNLIFCIYGAFACIGFYFGIFMAAIAVQFLDWRWYFWIGAIIEFIIVVGGFFSIPRRMNDILPHARMDWLGLGTIVPGLTLFVFALSAGVHAPDGWKTPYIYVTLVMGTAFLAGAVYTQGWVSAQPLLPSHIFKPAYFKRLIAGLFCYYGVFSLFLLYSTLYIENIVKASPIETATWFTPLAIGGIILGLAGGFMLHLIPGYVLMMLSGLGYFLSVLLFALIPDQSGSDGPSKGFLYWAYIFPAMCCATIGMDIMFNISNVFITSALPKRDQATAGAVLNSLMCLGIAFWLGIGDVAIWATGDRKKGEFTELDQYKVGFWTAVGLATLALALISTVRMGSATAKMTADEKERLVREEKANGSRKSSRSS